MSLGGDVAVGAVQDSPGHPWQVAVAEAPGDDPAQLLVLDSGGMATSTTTHRRWRSGGSIVHHVLDPRTGRPVERSWRTASVAAASCVAANTASTASLVLGAAAPAWLTERGLPARLVARRRVGHRRGRLARGGGVMTDALHSHLLWYLNRSTGVVLVAVLTLSTALGVLSASGAGSRWPRFARQGLHRNVSLIACALLVAHAVTPVLDTYVNHYAPIGWIDAVVPFVSAYQPLATGLGTLSLDLLVVVDVQQRGASQVRAPRLVLPAPALVRGLGARPRPRLHRGDRRAHRLGPRRDRGARSWP